MPPTDIVEYTASGKHKYTCNFCQGPDGSPLRLDKRRWNRHSKSAAHSSSRSLNATKRLQAFKSTPHERPAESVDDGSRAYNSSVHYEQGSPTLSSNSAPRYDGETTSSAAPDSEQPFTDGTTVHNANNNGTVATTENPDLFPATNEDPLVNYELNDPADGPETPLESGYEHWRTAYDSEDSCDDDDDDFDEMFTGYLASSGAQSSDTSRIIGGSSRAERSRQAPLAKSDSEPWFPWPSQSMFLADILFTANRLEFSRKQAKAVLAYARATGGKGVPTLSALARTRKEMLEVTGNPTTRHESDTGHVFHVNEDIANPITRENMCFYAHDTGKRVTQVWNATKILQDVSDDLLTPTIRHRNKIYYVNELVRCSGHWFIPLRWIMVGDSKAMYADGYMVEESEFGLQVIDDTRRRVPVSSFELSYPELQANSKFNIQFAPNSAAHSEKMPHPLRRSAGSRMVYAVPIMVFIDDVSGNSSTQWNKHNSVYMSNGTLPREELNSEFNVRYVTTSQHASPLELMKGVRESIEKSRRSPTVAYDCLNREEVVIRPYLLFIPADNPMQAELCSSCGLNSNRFCRTCDVGGTQEFKRSIDGYPTLFKTGKIRDGTETIETIKKQLGAATKVGGTGQVEQLASTSGIKDQVAQPHIETLLALGKKLNKERNGCSREAIEGILASELKKIEESASLMNPLLTMEGVDIHLDTPTEILHTVLLGVVKYFWAQTTHIIDRNKKLDLLSSRLDSLNHSGLNISSILGEYMVHYRGALIGKHFKTIAQIMPFVLYDNIVEDQLRNVWVLLGRLVVQLWATDIRNMKEYRSNLKRLIDDFLVAAAQCSPSIICTKPKFHFLVHIPDFIRRFGPAVLFSTERFESFNSIFRAASIFSNRKAPSLDIAGTMAHKDRIKHVCSGGFWKNGSHWVHSNKFVQEFLINNPQFGAFVGLVDSDKQEPGTAVLPSENTRGPCSWAEICKSFPSTAQVESAPGDMSSEYRVAISGVTSSGDVCKTGNNVAFGPQFGLVKVVFACRPGTTSPTEDCFYASVQLYSLLPNKDPQIDTPILVCSNNIIHIKLKNVICVVNLQHDCKGGKCLPNDLVRVWEERELTTRVRKLIKHSDDQRFLLNINSLHNSQILEHLLPSDLSTRRTYEIDRDEVLKIAVHKMGGVHAEKVTISAAKRKAKSTFNQTLNEAKGASSRTGGAGIIAHTSGQSMPPLSSKRKASEQSDAELDPGVQLRRQRVVDSDNTVAQSSGTSNTVPGNSSTQDAGNTNEPTSWEKHSESKFCTLDVLRHFCKVHSLPLYGLKATIVHRLSEFYNRSNTSLPSVQSIASVYDSLQSGRNKNPPSGIVENELSFTQAALEPQVLLSFSLLITPSRIFTTMGFASSDISDEDHADTQAEQTPAPNREQGDAQTSAPAEEQSEWSPQQLESLTDWADLCCEQYGVSDTNKSDIIEKASLSTHRLLVALFAKVTAAEIERANAVIVSFPKSRAYKDQLVPRIQGTLLDPALKFYVRGVTSRIVRHIQFNPAAYGVPREVQESYIYQKSFRLDIGKTCSSFRGEMKRKIDESIEDKEDLYTLTRKLCSTHVEATAELADRVALLRDYMQKWIKLTSTPDNPRPSWWAFMDSKCEKLWTVRPNEDEKKHKSRIQKAFSGAVTADLKAFPPSKHIKRFGRGARLTQWQINVSAAVKDMQQVEVTIEPGDAGEDDAGEATEATAATEATQV